MFKDKILSGFCEKKYVCKQILPANRGGACWLSKTKIHHTISGVSDQINPIYMFFFFF